MRRLIAIQDEFILTGYYPEDKQEPDDDKKEAKKKSVQFTVRLPDKARTLNEALEEGDTETVVDTA